MRKVYISHEVILDTDEENVLPELNLGGPCPLDGYGNPHDCDHCTVTVLHFDGKKFPQRFTCASDVRNSKDITSPVPERYLTYLTRSMVTEARVMTRDTRTELDVQCAVSHCPVASGNDSCCCWSCCHPESDV